MIRLFLKLRFHSPTTRDHEFCQRLYRHHAARERICQQPQGTGRRYDLRLRFHEINGRGRSRPAEPGALWTAGPATATGPHAAGLVGHRVRGLRQPYTGEAAPGHARLHPLHSLPTPLREEATLSEELGIINTVIKTLGAPGIIVICMGAPSLVMAFLYADHRRYERERLEAVKNEGLREAQFREYKGKGRGPAPGRNGGQQGTVHGHYQCPGEAVRAGGRLLREERLSGGELRQIDQRPGGHHPPQHPDDDQAGGEDRKQPVPPDRQGRRSRAWALIRNASPCVEYTAGELAGSARQGLGLRRRYCRQTASGRCHGREDAAHACGYRRGLDAAEHQYGVGRVDCSLRSEHGGQKNIVNRGVTAALRSPEGHW